MRNRFKNTPTASGHPSTKGELTNVWKNSWKHFIGMAVIIAYIGHRAMALNSTMGFIFGLCAVANVLSPVLGYVVEWVQDKWHWGTKSKTDFRMTIYGGNFGFIVLMIIKIFT